MQKIPQGFEKYNQFILWRAVPRANGKTDKVPVGRAGHDIDAHDKGQWLTALEAVALATSTGHGLAFVFTNDDPFFFIDIDDCYQNNAWTPRATEICQMFPGAAVEVSQSGRGLHVFGSGMVTDDRRCKSTDGSFDLYTKGRFVALVGTGLQGNALTDHTATLGTLVAGPLKQPSSLTDAKWTTEPIHGWNGPTDDLILINKILESKSNVFSDKISITQLWQADPMALAAAYPPDQGGDGYDHSKADAALCVHLAFWTGKNCERIDALMRLSGLMRDKWSKRKPYREQTILKAIGICKNVYGTGKRDEPPVVATGGGDQYKMGNQLMTPSQQLEYFGGCVYIRDIHRVFTQDGALLRPEQFKATYGGYDFSIDAVNGKQSRNAWEVFTESRAIKFPKATGICFRPELPSGQVVEEEGNRLVNTHVSINTPAVAGDASPFIDLVHKLLPDAGDFNIMMAYMAACVQYKGVKFQWAPLLQGCEGNGKSLLTTCVAYAVGRRYTHLPNAADLSNKFNAWILNKLFIGVEEVYVSDKQELIDALKPMITNSYIEVQGKGQDQITADNRANFILNTNHRDAYRKTKHDRRMCIFYTAQQEADDLTRDGMGGQYFPELYKWLRGGGYAIVNHHLAQYAIPDALNPATECHRAPVTSTTDQVITESLGYIEQEIMEAISSGRQGFRGGWISSFAFNQMIEGRRVGFSRRHTILTSLGYVKHPSLRDGRVTTVIPTEGGKPRLYIKKGHILSTIKNKIVDAYLKSQMEQGDINNAQVNYNQGG